MPRGIALYASGLLFSAAIGAGIAALIVATALLPTTPHLLRSGEELERIPVTIQDYRDPLPVELRVIMQESSDITLYRSGTLTRWDCSEGVTIQSGTSTFAVDGSNLLNISTGTPLWRDLDLGISGPDVRALEDELLRLGYDDVQVDGVLGQADMSALSALSESAGVVLGERLPRNAFVWLPSQAVRIDSCKAGLGHVVSEGENIAKVAGNLTVLPLELPAERLDGPRYLEGFGALIDIGELGDLLADDVDSIVRDSPAFRDASTNSPTDATVVVRGTAVLRVPVPIASIPASAVLVDSTTRGCTFSDSTAYRVRIAGSQLGNTFVLFEGEAPRHIDPVPPSGVTECT